MDRSALVFITTAANKNSIAALAGIVETHREFDALPLLFLRDDERLPTRFARALETYQQLIVAFSFCTLQRDRVRQVLQCLRGIAAERGHGAVHWLGGGPHPSGDPRDALALGLDLVVIGEAEETLPTLLRGLLADGEIPSLAGLALLREGELLTTGRAPHVRDLDAYAPYAPRHRWLGAIEITRGCPYACRFCQTPYLFGGRVRHRTPDVVAHWTAQARFKGIPFMHFVTPNALAYGSPDGRTTNLAAIEELLLKVGAITGRERVYLGSFPSEVRPEMVTPEAIALIKRLAGNTHITVGAQSGSPRMLEMLHRGHTVEDVYRACDIILRQGLVPDVDVMLGLPGETEEDRRLTLALITKLTDWGARVRTHAFMPLVGTPLAGAAPGVIDAETDRLLGQLARRGRQHGARRRGRRE